MRAGDDSIASARGSLRRIAASIGLRPWAGHPRVTAIAVIGCREEA